MKTLPVKGASYINRIVNLYSELWYKKYGIKPRVNYAITGKLFKSIVEEYGEVAVGLSVILHFEWRGMNDDNTFLYKILEDNSFPITWIPKRIPEYLSFFKNYVKLDINNEDELLDIFNSKVKSLKLWM